MSAVCVAVFCDGAVGTDLSWLVANSISFVCVDVDGAVLHHYLCPNGVIAVVAILTIFSCSDDFVGVSPCLLYLQ